MVCSSSESRSLHGLSMAIILDCFHIVEILFPVKHTLSIVLTIYWSLDQDALVAVVVVYPLP